MREIETFEKQPAEIRDYDVDMAGYFAVIPGDDIQSVDLSVTGSGASPELVLGPDALPAYQLVGDPPTRFKIWIGGGVSGSSYQVTARVTTEGGRVEEIDMKFKVKER